MPDIKTKQSHVPCRAAKKGFWVTEGPAPTKDEQTALEASQTEESDETAGTSEDDEESDNALPPFINFGRLKEIPPLPDALIRGVLRKGGKMVVTGPSKAGKSQCVLGLSLAVALGRQWMKRLRCEKGIVAYINLEVGEAQFLKRAQDTAKAYGIEREELGDNLLIMNVRGCGMTMGNGLEEAIIERCTAHNISLLILDPVYKTLAGDENKACDVAVFTRALDKICERVQCSVVYIHHHSKGAQGGKATGDRGSGSGVITRDVDALIDLVELDTDDDDPIYRVETVLRDYKPLKFEARFHYPTFEAVRGYESARYKIGSKTGAEKRGDKKELHATAKNLYERMRKESVNGIVAKRDFLERFAELHSVGTETVRAYFSRDKAFPLDSKPIENPKAGEPRTQVVLKQDKPR